MRSFRPAAYALIAFWLVVGAILLHACEPSFAAPPSCTIAAWSKLDAAVVEQGWSVTELTVNQRVRFLRAYNSVPPKTDLTAAHVFVVSHGGGLLVALTDGAGCVAQLGRMSPDMLAKWIGAAS